MQIRGFQDAGTEIKGAISYLYGAGESLIRFFVAVVKTLAQGSFPSFIEFDHIPFI